MRSTILEVQVIPHSALAQIWVHYLALVITQYTKLWFVFVFSDIPWSQLGFLGLFSVPTLCTLVCFHRQMQEMNQTWKMNKFAVKPWRWWPCALLWFQRRWMHSVKRRRGRRLLLIYYCTVTASKFWSHLLFYNSKGILSLNAEQWLQPIWNCDVKYWVFSETIPVESC